MAGCVALALWGQLGIYAGSGLLFFRSLQVSNLLSSHFDEGARKEML